MDATSSSSETVVEINMTEIFKLKCVLMPYFMIFLVHTILGFMDPCLGIFNFACPPTPINNI